MEDNAGDGEINKGGRILRFHRLKPFEGIFGPIESIELEDHTIMITIAGVTLRYPQLSREGKFLKKRIHQDYIGRKVGILNCRKQLRIRWMDNDNIDMKPDPFKKWCCERYGIPEGV